MAFCQNCGAAVDGAFCTKCGTAVATGGTTAAPPPRVTSAPGLTHNIASALCYILLLVGGIIFLVVDPYKKDRKVRFDAFQSIFLFIAMMIVNSVVNIAIGDSYSLYTIHQLLQLAELCLCVYLAFKAYQNEKVILPVIGPLAEKQA